MGQPRRIIAVDFDGCLCQNRWPEIGEPNDRAIEKLIRRKHEGDKIILWTCRIGERLEEAVRWCEQHGIIFDAVNDNLQSEKDSFGTNPRKIYAHEYWDDRAVKVEAEPKQI